MPPMKSLIRTLMLCFATGLLASCGQSSTEAPEGTSKPADIPEAAQTTTPKQENDTVTDANHEVAVIKTTAGEIVIEFWPDVAPKTIENFKKLANQNFYDGTAFHRIVKGFMIQGGDPLTKDPAMENRWGTGDPGYKIPAEFNDRLHERGVISMARSAQPDSAGSQFFICLAKADFLDGKYTAFGKLIKGDEVLGALGDAATVTSASGEKSKPVQRQGVESIRIVPRSSLP